MRKLSLLSLLIFLSICCYSSTNITTPTVSGHWTISGSPYKVMNDITVPSGTTLTIDPGVEVVFSGFYGMLVNGGLVCLGTATAPVVFHAQDTTGWSNQGTLGGGWSGIKIEADYMHPATSSLDYTTIRDMKYTLGTGYLFQVNNTPLKMTGCSFYHNSANHVTSVVIDGSIITFSGTAFATEMDHCSVYANNASLDIIRASSGGIDIHDCTFYNNKAGVIHSAGCVLDVISSQLILTNNVFHDNVCADGTISSIYTNERKVLISGNKIYTNKNWGNAAITCFAGRTIIENNYVCNNTDDSATCGIAAGGGAIHVAGEYGSITSTDTITKIVRNNIIANNQSSSRGSAIYVYQCNAAIVNNHIINNNNSGVDGAISGFWGDNINRLIVRNNVISGNVNGTPGIVSDLYFSNNKRLYLQYDHNWTDRAFATNVFSPFGADSVMRETDVATNLTGSNAGMAAPTLTASVTESALTADFKIMSTSACVNAGAACGYSGFYDCLDNYRTSGSAIDIGAYEYGATPFPMGTPTVIAESAGELRVCPNPTTGLLSVHTQSASGEIVVYDVSGKLSMKQQVTNTTTVIDLSSCRKGLYFLTWHDENGGRLMQKVVVE